MVLGDSLPKALSCDKCGLVIAATKRVGGYVYVLSNKCIPDLVKIGFSTRAVESRIAELNASTSIPEPFKLEASFPVEQPLEQEAAVHAKLASYRHSETREFFRLQVSQAIMMVKKALLAEVAIEMPGDTDGIIKVFGTENGRGAIVEITPTNAFAGFYETFTLPDGQKFRLEAAFLVKNRSSCASTLNYAVAHQRNGFEIWQVKIEEALGRVAKVARENQRPTAAAEGAKNDLFVVSKAPEAPIFWSPLQSNDKKP